MKMFFVMAALVLLSTTASRAEPAPAPHGSLAPGLSGHPPPPDPASGDSKGIISGKVLETMDAAGYTYVRVADAGGEIWAAGPQTSVKVGDTVTFPRGMVMKNFRSEKLGRTFENIAFVNSIAVGEPAASSAERAKGKADPHGAIAKSGGASIDLSGIERAEGGKTVGEIFDQKESLAGKEVLLRAKVVKANFGIMGRNWLHVKDGTTSSAGAEDLTVTTSGTAEVGTLVLVRGKVSVNKDFGFGYHYDVMIEDAALTVEKAQTEASAK